jgi:hypothetical protein
MFNSIANYCVAFIVICCGIANVVDKPIQSLVARKLVLHYDETVQDNETRDRCHHSNRWRKRSIAFIPRRSPSVVDITQATLPRTYIMNNAFMLYVILHLTTATRQRT